MIFINGFLKAVENIPKMSRVLDDINTRTLPMNITGLSEIHKAHITSYLATRYGDKPILLVTPDEASGKKLCEDIETMLGEGSAVLYPARDINFRKSEAVSREYEHLRLLVLGRVLSRDVKVVVASAVGATQLVTPPHLLKEATFTIDSKKPYNLEELRKRLVTSGYSCSAQIEGISQFSSRGGILDIYSPHEKAPVRIEFWGDDIDSMSYFDVETQRRTESITKTNIMPACEVLCEPARLRGIIENILPKVKNKDAKFNLENDIKSIDSGLELSDIDKYLPLIYSDRPTLFDYFDDSLVLVSNIAGGKDSVKSSLVIAQEDEKALFLEGVLTAEMRGYSLDFTELADVLYKRGAIYLETFAQSVSEIKQKSLNSITATAYSGFSGEVKYLAEDVRDSLEKGNHVVIFAGTEKGARNLAHDLENDGIKALFMADIPSELPNGVLVTSGTLSGGFEYGGLSVFSHAKTLNIAKKSRTKKKKEEMIRSLADLSVGDFVVHISYGIGIFDGIQKLDLHGIVKDYIKIKYAKADTLYVPVTQLDMVSKYIGPRDDGKVKLNRLNSTEWHSTKARVKKEVADMADELIKLYAERAQSKGFAFSEDTDWQKNFEEHFDYEETDDQLRCIAEIKADMEKPQPMERLLCGDVGFGKTEVALRGAFKCVMDSKQCAILVPTTILAWQHYQTALARFCNFPVKIELLSRFRTPKQQEKILRELERGEIDIIIGTHRLVQDDVKFRDLGLVIIDEEQRFGVKHKDKFKETFKGVDILTLSATPIPRTLNMAMSGIRDMSVIEEAPQNRHPVQTYVLEQDMGVISEAIKKELRRGGQVYYLHNRVETIEETAFKLKNLIPDARIEVAHGKMGEETLSKVWKRLIEGEIDVLCSTTIIETGVDVPNVNTLIIEDADRLGLSQLYQLRGRVGRSSRRAFAYFMFKRGKVLNEVATKRLSAIREFTKFGSGFNIAMRDLQIRGAGNILGAKQHGHMETVGYDMYLRLLSDVMAEKKGETPQQKSYECLVDISISAHIPESYIENLALRLDVYRKIALIKTNDDAEDVIDELIDRFGETPPAVLGLIDVAVTRNMAANQGVREIKEQAGSLVFYFERLNIEKASYLAGELKGRVLVNASEKPYISVKMQKGEKSLALMKKVIEILSTDVL